MSRRHLSVSFSLLGAWLSASCIGPDDDPNWVLLPPGQMDTAASSGNPLNSVAVPSGNAADPSTTSPSTSSSDVPSPQSSTTAGSNASGATTSPAATTTGEGSGIPSSVASGDVAPDAGPVEPDELRGPTPAANGANFPFPQNRTPKNCYLATQYRNADVLAAFEKWKADTVTSEGAGGHLRIKRTPSDTGLEQGSTVSEGIAYGMLIAVYMNEQNLFDELWKYSQLWLDEQGLMDWYINAAGSERLGTGAATDADEDIAWALIMADKQWGGGGTLEDSYINIAKGQIDKVWRFEVLDGKLILPGDEWGGWSTVNVSYFMPNYYRTFAQVTGNAGWNDVISTSYDTLENTLNDANGNLSNGLVPAWATSDGVPNSGAWMSNDAPTHYQYDSCRTPFRIGVDYCFNGEARAKDYVSKTSSFFSQIGIPDLVDGYDLNGTPRPQYPSGQSAAFIGPATVGAITDATYEQFVSDGYDALRGLDLLTGGAYYDESWTVLSLLMLTGNFLDYTQEEPFTGP